MGNCNRPAVQRQQCIAKQVQTADANRFFDLLSGPELRDVVEAQLPEHRERDYPPTLTLSMFLGQVMSADGSCQNAVNELNVNRGLMGLSPLSGDTGGYCTARKRLPLEMVQVLAQETGRLLGTHTPAGW